MLAPPPLKNVLHNFPGVHVAANARGFRYGDRPNPDAPGIAAYTEASNRAKTFIKERDVTAHCTQIHRIAMRFSIRIGKNQPLCMVIDYSEFSRNLLRYRFALDFDSMNTTHMVALMAYMLRYYSQNEAEAIQRGQIQEGFIAHAKDVIGDDFDTLIDIAADIAITDMFRVDTEPEDFEAHVADVEPPKVEGWDEPAEVEAFHDDDDEDEDEYEDEYEDDDEYEY